MLSVAASYGASIRRRLEVRRAQRAANVLLAARGPVPEGTAEVVVYFPDGRVNLYQLRQWYEPLRILARTHPVVIVTRTAHATLAALEESGLPVVQLRRIGDFEAWLATQHVRAVLYVNQNVRNFSALRFADPAHVFVSHGESDKAYMASNQTKAYDYAFVAGQAAIDRLGRALVGLDPARLVPIGRPQVDVNHAGPELPQDARTTVLYAPTWEGDRPSMSYSSVASHGRALVRSLVATRRHRVVYRPHPRTGYVDRDVARADREIREMLAAADRADPGAGHIVDTGGDYGWQLDAADFCLTDVSAVAFDWLATGKPFAITEPTAPEAVVDSHGLVGAVRLLPAASAHEAPDVVDAGLAQGLDDELRALVSHYFGDTSPGASLRRFCDAVHDVVVRRERELEARDGGRLNRR